MRLKNILLVVSDMERSKAFYRELFGMEALGHFEGNVVLAGGIALQEQTGWEAVTGQTVAYGGCDMELYFETYGMDTFLEKLEHCAFAVEYCSSTEQGERLVRFCDPDRHRIEVREKRK